MSAIAFTVLVFDDLLDDHTIRSATAENPLLFANFTALSSLEPALLPTEVLHCRNEEFRVFLREIVENITIQFVPQIDADDAETHLLAHYRLFCLVCFRSYTSSRCLFTPNR